jgi:DNA-binding MarR family transcriptional regulator
MEERGLVERGRDETDRRVILIRLAEAGTAVTSEMLEQRRTRLRRVLAELSPDEVAGFLKGIRAMRAARERLLAQTGEGQEP